MKIPGSTGDDKKINLNSDTRVAEQSTSNRAGLLRGVAGGATEILAPTGKEETDSFTVSQLGAQINTELDPAKMAEERRQKVEDLKKRIQNGTYQPPLTDVARSLSEELSLEILLLGQGVADQETDNGLL